MLKLFIQPLKNIENVYDWWRLDELMIIQQLTQGVKKTTQ